MEGLLFKTAFGLYAVSTGLGLAYLFSRNETLAVWKFRLLVIGLLAHLVSFALLTDAFWASPENRHFLPIHGFYGALSYLALANAFVFFIVQVRTRLHILGAFVLPWTAIAAGAAVFAHPELGPVKEELRSFRMNLHPMLFMLSYTAFANAFGVGLALLIQERQIKSRKPTELCYRLPPIEELDALHLRIITAAFPALTLGLLMGSNWGYSEWTRFWAEPKLIAGVITWAIYGAFLYIRLAGNRRGRRPVYIAMAGFVWILLSFVLVNYLSSQHGFLYGR